MDKWVIKKPRLSDEASTSSGNDRSQTLSNVVLSSSTSQSVPVHSQNIEQIGKLKKVHKHLVNINFSLRYLIMILVGMLVNIEVGNNKHI